MACWNAVRECELKPPATRSKSRRLRDPRREKLAFITFGESALWSTLPPVAEHESDLRREKLAFIAFGESALGGEGGGVGASTDSKSSTRPCWTAPASGSCPSMDTCTRSAWSSVLSSTSRSFDEPLGDVRKREGIKLSPLSLDGSRDGFGDGLSDGTGDGLGVTCDERLGERRGARKSRWPPWADAPGDVSVSSSLSVREGRGASGEECAASDDDRTASGNEPVERCSRSAAWFMLFDDERERVVTRGERGGDALPRC